MRYAVLLALLSTLAFLPSPGHAAPYGPNLIKNGGFESVGFATPTQMNTTNVPFWSTNGYNFVFFPGTADSPGSYTPQFNGNITFWGPKSGSANGLTATSPAGGNFVGADGAFQTEAIVQSVAGLTIGTDYLLSFYWGAAQQAGFDGATTENWTVSFGDQTLSTPWVNNASHGFVPWVQQSMVFRARSTTQTLSFLAGGTPAGLPPFSLLDGVTLFAVPEPMAVVLLLGAVSTVIGARLRRS